MAGKSYEVLSGNADYVASWENAFQVRAQGLRKALRALEAAGADAQDMRNLMHNLGEIVAQRGRQLSPVVSGRLRGSIRAGRGKTKAVVRMGGAAVPYAPVVHYGWPDRNIDENRFMDAALDETWNQVFAAFENGIADLLRKNNLT